MIPRLSTKHSIEGGMLLVTLVVTAVIGVMLTAYLSMVSGQHGFTQRSQTWNNCIPMCEAGVEDALAHLNHNLTRSNFAINGWVKYGNYYRKNPVGMNGGVYYVAFDTNWPPNILSTGRVDYPITSTPIYRAVHVKTKINQRFPNALLAKATIRLNGNGRVDSFNSTNSLESTNGQYNAALATDRASVATTSRIAGDLSVGNVSVYGSVGTGPGGSVSVLPGGNVGSEGFNDNPAYDGQIETGHITDDVNVYIPDVTFPSPWGPPLVWPNALPYLWTNGVTYNRRFQFSGDYVTPSVNISAEKWIIQGKVRIRVNGPTQITSMAVIELAPDASVEWYGFGNISFSGGGVINGGGLAKNFSVFGMTPSCTSVMYDGSAQFIGTIYAPNATVTLTGTSDGFGAIVGRIIELKGTMSFHYDEALKGDPKEGRFLAASWRELPTN